MTDALFPADPPPEPEPCTHPGPYLERVTRLGVPTGDVRCTRCRTCGRPESSGRPVTGL